MVDFICIDRVKIFLSNIAKLKMLRYKHIFILPQEIYRSISDPEDEYTLI